MRQGGTKTVMAHRTFSDSHATSTEVDDWWARMACSESDASLFFAPDSEPGVAIPREENQNRIAKAKAICARCTVTKQCYSDAVQAKDRFSIAGGTTPAERGWKRSRA